MEAFQKALDCTSCCDDLVIHAHARTEDQSDPLSLGLWINTDHRSGKWPVLLEKLKALGKRIGEVGSGGSDGCEKVPCQIRAVILLSCKAGRKTAEDVLAATNACYVYYADEGEINFIGIDEFGYFQDDTGEWVFNPRTADAYAKKPGMQYLSVVANPKGCVCSPATPPPPVPEASHE